jgi:kynureninase
LIEQLDRGYQLRLVDNASELASAIDEDTAVAMITHVNYRTGAMHDMAALTRVIHAAGALAVWDLAHSAGAAIQIFVGASNGVVRARVRLGSKAASKRVHTTTFRLVGS